MKKILNSFVLVIATFFVGALFVNAETKNVTVGDVEEPLYSVDITWDNLAFDYLFNEITNEYGWYTSDLDTMVQIETDTLYNLTKDYSDMGLLLLLYKDTNRTQRLTIDELKANDKSIVKARRLASPRNEGFIITDTSRFGKVNPRISWTIDTKYSYTDLDVVFNGPSDYTPIESGDRIGDFDYSPLAGFEKTWDFVVGVHNKTTPATLPTSGDKLATITIELN